MRKGKNTILKTVAASALTATLAVSMGATAAFAADVDGVTAVSTDGSASVTENLKIAKQGVQAPAATYTFKFAQVGTNPANINISDKTVTVSAKDSTASGTITKTASNLFDGVSFTKAGIYSYDVTQSVDNTGVTADDTKYFVQVKVKNTGNGSNTFTIAGVTAQKYKTDGTKDSKQATIDFGSIYTKYAHTDESTVGDNGGNVENGLTISKTVTGEGADYTDTFAYTITFAKDDVNDGLELKADKALGSVAANTALDYDKAYTFTLQNGGSINFKVPAGTTYTVKETEANGYSASVALVENGTTVTNKGAADTITAAVAGEKKNTVTFTNTKNSDVLTGVLTENAPFIAMVAAAVLALVGYVAVRRRKAN